MFTSDRQDTARGKGLESRVPFRAGEGAQHLNVSVGKPGAVLDARDPCGRRRKWTPMSWCLPATHVPGHACPHRYLSTHTR